MGKPTFDIANRSARPAFQKWAAQDEDAAKKKADVSDVKKWAAAPAGKTSVPPVFLNEVKKRSSDAEFGRRVGDAKMARDEKQALDRLLQRLEDRYGAEARTQAQEWIAKGKVEGHAQWKREVLDPINAKRVKDGQDPWPG